MNAPRLRSLSVLAAIPAALLCSCAAYQQDEQDNDEIVTLDQVPPAAREAIQAHLGGATIDAIERSTDEGPTPYYDVRATGPSGSVEFEVTEDGAYRPDSEDDDGPLGDGDGGENDDR